MLQAALLIVRFYQELAPPLARAHGERGQEAVAAPSLLVACEAAAAVVDEVAYRSLSLQQPCRLSFPNTCAQAKNVDCARCCTFAVLRWIR